MAILPLPPRRSFRPTFAERGRDRGPGLEHLGGLVAESHFGVAEILGRRGVKRGGWQPSRAGFKTQPRVHLLLMGFHVTAHLEVRLAFVFVAPHYHIQEGWEIRLLDAVLALGPPLHSILVQHHEIDPVIQPNLGRRLRAAPKP